MERPRRKQILALDGGGVRGAISVAFLERLEELLRARGDERPLCEVFDLVGGTSTGAIIAGAIALGHSAAEIREFYLALAPRIFRRSRWRIAGVQSRFDAAPLMREIERIVGERTLDSPEIRTRLAIVLKRMDTGSPWVVTTSPNARYWNDPDDRGYLGNRHYKLKNLIRASTAAPHYFEPEPIPIVSSQPPGLFVDGAVSPHNNPALLLAMVATVPAYGFGWPWGADNLAIVSVGTGRFRATLDPLTARRMTSVGLAIRALSGLIGDAGEHALALCQWLGETPRPVAINSELGTMEGVKPPPLFRFRRWDVELTQPALAALGVTVGAREVAALREIDNAAAIPLAYDVGRRAAERIVELDD